MPEETSAPEVGGGGGGEVGGGGGVNPQEAVKAPATFLLVVGIIGLVLAVLTAVAGLVGIIMGLSAGGNQGTALLIQGVIRIVIGILASVGSIVVILGAKKMKNLESSGFAMAASVIAMLPIVSGCCLLGLPAGIWSIIVLMKPEVKAAFK